jgi:hypothetical protein
VQFFYRRRHSSNKSFSKIGIRGILGLVRLSALRARAGEPDQHKKMLFSTDRREVLEAPRIGVQTAMKYFFSGEIARNPLESQDSAEKMIVNYS